MSQEHIAYHNILRYQDSHKERENLYNLHKSWSSAFQAMQIGNSEELPRNQKLIIKSDANFPPLLREIPNSTHGLYYQGEDPVMEKGVAIVGTRKASRQGLEIAFSFAKVLAKSGIRIISGLALGLDGASHRGALAAGGRTVAVLPCGLNRIYPRQHQGLAEEIIKQGGSLISEYYPQRGIEKYQFLERNRIISGLSLLTIIIEAPKRSGALSTARHCIEQNRELAVIPGPIDQLNYQGSNELIQQGAYLLTSPEEIFELLKI